MFHVPVLFAGNIITIILRYLLKMKAQIGHRVCTRLRLNFSSQKLVTGFR